ncbi:MULTISPECIES: LysM peptidoglycan-binding domain-containing protein [Flavobacteriaceae]|uniref:LysM peptidoglycan-binding domain-containing protein n=2 Tax=Flavobacteriaceae TaxID=49546 RepID=A0A4Y8ATU6_9FLAO|nr:MULTISPECIES: LysM peptidoglycan-binding domain-containing protein [Flavobacteriaceae]TEW75279.1 LysM peptidoglycan-binding domain-containing protein [Gramella jeungdoensis]
MKKIKFLISILAFCAFTMVAQQKKYVSYTVKKGETMKTIAKDYDVSTRDLLRLNPDIGRKPKENTVIIVPNKNYGKQISKVKETEIYIVRPKETLFGISNKHNITIEELKEANPVLENGLKIGMHLKIPVSKTEENDSEKFILHTVIKDDTVYNLTKKYEVSAESLYALNPTLIDGLKLGMILKIKPIAIPNANEEGEVETEAENEEGLFVEALNFKKSINVAIMLPYELQKYSDSIPEKELTKWNSILNIATDFHMGASMAIDSLRSKGMTVNVQYFDTQDSNYKLQTIVNNSDFSETDVIIGPLFYKKAYWLSKHVNVPVIAPIYSKSQNSLSASNLIKSDDVSDTLLEEHLLNYMKENYKGENILVINDSEEQSQSKLWRIVNHLKSFDSIQNITVLKSDKGYIDNEKFAGKLIKNSANWVFLISDEIVTTAAAVNNLKVFMEEFNITLFTTGKGKNFDKIDNSFLGQLNFTYPTTDFVNMQDLRVKNFYAKFRSKNFTLPSKYAVRGFDVTYDILLRLASEDGIEDALRAGKSSRISAIFNYNKKLFGSFENNGVYIVQYNKELAPVIVE